MAVFEQDPAFPFFGTEEDRVAFRAARYAKADEKKSSIPPVVMGNIQGGVFSKRLVVPKLFSKCSTVSNAQNFCHQCQTQTTMC